MKHRTLTIALTLGLLAALFEGACVSTLAPLPPSAAEQIIANAVEDVITIGLVPVLSKNPSYAPAAQTVALALGSFTGSTITQADTNAFLAKVPSLSPADRDAIAGIVNAAWSVYVKRYQQQLGANTRPDVKLFLSAVSNGIASAVAALPK